MKAPLDKVTAELGSRELAVMEIQRRTTNLSVSSGALEIINAKVAQLEAGKRKSKMQQIRSNQRRRPTKGA